jgi:hypothetical protein
MHKQLNISILNTPSLFNNESKCEQKIRQAREKQGVVCKKCQSTSHYWKSDKKCWECKSCKFRTSLKSGTIMEYSKLPLQYWLLAMALMSMTKKGMSVLELQKQLSHKIQEPIWAMMHKIWLAMGAREDKYKLHDWVELDHGFFEIDFDGQSQKAKATVMVCTQVDPLVVEPKKGKARPKTSVQHLRMSHVDDMTKESTKFYTDKLVDEQAHVITDNHQSYKELSDVVKSHTAIQYFDKILSSSMLPWVHIAIGNAKRWLLGIHHSVNSDFLQNYFNEFCFKFNRRYFGPDLLERLIIAVVQPTFFFR